MPGSGRPTKGPSLREPADPRSEPPRQRDTGSLAGEPRLLLGGAARGIPIDFRRTRRVSVGARNGKLEHPRNAALAEDRIPLQLVVHVAALGHEPGILDVAYDLDLVHAIARARGAHDVLLDHHAAHVVRAEREAQLPDFPSLRYPRRLEVVEIIEH